MTVEELISLNMMLTDIKITVRIGGSKLLDELNIGPDYGKEPRYPTTVPIDENHIGSNQRKKAVYMDKNINTWDDGKDYWQLKVDRIPKKWRNLEVYSFQCSHVYRRNHWRYSVNPNGDYQGLHITALPSGESLRENDTKPNKAAGDDQLEGQMDISDILGG